MRYFYHAILWSSLALVIGPLAFIFLAGWELSKVPGLFDVSLTFDEDSR